MITTATPSGVERAFDDKTRYLLDGKKHVSPMYPATWFDAAEALVGFDPSVGKALAERAEEIVLVGTPVAKVDYVEDTDGPITDRIAAFYLACGEAGVAAAEKLTTPRDRSDNATHRQVALAVREAMAKRGWTDKK